MGNWSNYIQKTSGTTDLNQSRTINKFNEITDINETIGTAWITPTYDRNGSMTTVPKQASLASSYACYYDGWNRLVEIKDAGVSVGTYIYDGRFRRIAKYFDSSSPTATSGIDSYEHSFYSTAWQLLEIRHTASSDEQPDTVTPLQQFVHSARLYGDPALSFVNLDNDDQCDDEIHYLLSTDLSSVCSLISHTAVVLERRIQSPYGTLIVSSLQSYNWPSSVAFDLTGQLRDKETGLLHFRARQYTSDLGLFCTWDLLAHRGVYHRMLYCRGNPVRYIDPSGLAEQTPSADPFAKDCCGPDVTNWYFNDLKAHAAMLRSNMEKARFVLTGARDYVSELGFFKYQAKYFLSHKWMPFDAPGCATGRCTHTVKLGHVCLRKNQLGNIGFMFLAALLNPGGWALDLLDPAKFGYSITPKHSSGKYRGKYRTDNLAAFGVGAALGEREGVLDSSEAFATAVQETLYDYDALRRFEELNKSGHRITHHSLTFREDLGGFSTHNCKPCGKTFVSAMTSIQYIQQLVRQFERDHDAFDPAAGYERSFDRWLKSNFEDYSK